MVAAGGTSGGAPAAPYAYAGAQRSRATSPTRIAGSASSQPATASLGSTPRRSVSGAPSAYVSCSSVPPSASRARKCTVAVAPAYARAAAGSAARTVVSTQPPSPARSTGSAAARRRAAREGEAARGKVADGEVASVKTAVGASATTSATARFIIISAAARGDPDDSPAHGWLPTGVC